MELNKRQEENIVKLMASQNDQDFNLAYKIALELKLSENDYEKLVNEANKLIPSGHKLWPVEQCKLFYKIDLDKLKTENNG